MANNDGELALGLIMSETETTLAAVRNPVPYGFKQAKGEPAVEYYGFQAMAKALGLFDELPAKLTIGKVTYHIQERPKCLIIVFPTCKMTMLLPLVPQDHGYEATYKGTAYRLNLFEDTAGRALWMSVRVADFTPWFRSFDLGAVRAGGHNWQHFDDTNLVYSKDQEWTSVVE